VGRLHEAVTDYQQLFSSNRNAELLNLLGLASFQLKAYADAIQYFRKCVKIKPDFAQARLPRRHLDRNGRF
jgi:tetratricopeptide (TPR) repeat protein